MRGCLMMLALVFAADAAVAQTLNAQLQGEQPYFRYTATVPDALRENGTVRPLELDLFVSRSGDVQVAKTASAANLCDPICWQQGNPPRPVCLLFQGCPGAPGTGPGPTLLSPILVELSVPEETGTAGAPTLMTLSVRPVSQERVNAPLLYQLNIPAAQ